jgi:hypothetical protein
MLFFNLTAGNIIYFADTVLFMVIGAVFSGLGAILAIKYLNLN